MKTLKVNPPKFWNPGDPRPANDEYGVRAARAKSGSTPTLKLWNSCGSRQRVQVITSISVAFVAAIILAG